MGGEIGRDGADLRQQPGQGVAVPFGGDAPSAFSRKTGEADRTAQIARHAAPGAIVMQDPRPNAPDPDGSRAFVGLAGFAKFYIGSIAGAGSAAVGGIPAGLQDQCSGDGGPPDGLAGPGRDRFAFAERLLRERLPHRIGEIPSEMGEADHRVLGAVHPARQRRHQGDGGNDAHDLPGAEAEPSLAGGIERAGHRVPDQQEPRQRQHTAIEDEQHVAQHELRPAPISPRKASTSRVALSEPANKPRSMVCAAAGSDSSPAIPRPIKTVPASRARRPIQERARIFVNRSLFAFGVLATESPFLVSCTTFGGASAGTGSRNGRILRTSSAEDRTASVRERVNSGANRKRSAPMGVSSLRRPGWRGRAEGACAPWTAPARWRRWRHAVRRACSGASRASARPLAE